MTTRCFFALVPGRWTGHRVIGAHLLVIGDAPIASVADTTLASTSPNGRRFHYFAQHGHSRGAALFTLAAASKQMHPRLANYNIRAPVLVFTVAGEKAAASFEAKAHINTALLCAPSETRHTFGSSCFNQDQTLISAWAQEQLLLASSRQSRRPFPTSPYAQLISIPVNCRQ